jgi:hypothetical protein
MHLEHAPKKRWPLQLSHSVGGMCSNYGPVMSGQGTIALELLEQVPDLDAIIVPVSGGGMLSGIAVAAKALNPQVCSSWFPQQVGPIDRPIYAFRPVSYLFVLRDIVRARFV